ncbi:winged helix-turn-helix domain-containing protein [Chloroflexota bacterium]
MFRVSIVGDATEQIRGLSSGLIQQGFACSITANDEDAIKQIIGQAPDLVLVAEDRSTDALRMEDLVNRIKQRKYIPAIALISREILNSLDLTTNNIDDFVLNPWDATEVMARAKRVLRRTKLIDDEELIRCGDLMIDKATCEVSISGRLIELTFKEYELLIFLASNRGRVYTREVLLDKVWGYDYFGGDRTVDVHIRRLRSKIEDSNHTFIETVRNIGYRFKKEI